MKRVALWTLGLFAVYLSLKNMPDVVRYIKIVRM